MPAGRFSRRRFLTTAGVGVTLPMLPSLMHDKRASAATCGAPKRFVVYFYPNGNHMPDMNVTGIGTGSGSAWQLPPAMASHADVKSDILLVTGLENQQRRRELGDHAIGCGALLTARKPTLNQPVNNTSVDQIIADSLKGCRGIDSLQLGTHNSGPPDTFGSFYTRSVSWRGPATVTAPDGTLSFETGTANPLGKEIDAKKAFDKLFAGTDPKVSAAEAEMRRALRKSVLDIVKPHQSALQNKLASDDRAKLDQLFTGIRDLETKLQAGGGTAASCTPPAAPATMLDFQKQLDTMHTLIGIALQCDVTRVITFMMGDAGNSRNLSFIPEVAAQGGDAGDHNVSHHANQPAALAKYRAMCIWKQQQMALFIKKLKSLQDADGKTVLSNTLVMMVSELADGARHNHDDKPIILAGQLGGLVTTDRHLRYPTSKDYTQVKSYGDFYITLMNLFDIKVKAFGNDGKEAIAWNR